MTRGNLVLKWVKFAKIFLWFCYSSTSLKAKVISLQKKFKKKILKSQQKNSTESIIQLVVAHFIVILIFFEPFAMFVF